MIVRTVDIRVLVLMRAISAVRQAGRLSRTSKRSACDSVHYTSLFRAATMSSRSAATTCRRAGLTKLSNAKSTLGLKQSLELVKRVDYGGI